MLGSLFRCLCSAGSLRLCLRTLPFVILSCGVGSDTFCQQVLEVNNIVILMAERQVGWVDYTTAKCSYTGARFSTHRQITARPNKIKEQCSTTLRKTCEFLLFRLQHWMHLPQTLFLPEIFACMCNF